MAFTNTFQEPAAARCMKMGEINGLTQMDITGGDVTLQIRDDKKVLWVNVNGVCVLRVCRIDKFHIDL